MAYAIDPRILREYDVRGVVGRGLDADAARAIGRSFASVVRRGGGRRIAVGYDGRRSSPVLEAALVEGLRAAGADVVRTGLGPSPMLYFAEATLGVDAGVQVTGSHNPKDQNGFKLVLGHRAFFGESIQRLARIAAAGDWTSGAGAVADAAVLDAYVDHLAAVAPAARLRVGWDAGNGAAGPALVRLCARLAGEHRTLFAEVDGDFPHHHPDPTVEANLAHLKAEVAAHRLDLGFAFDGDGDRLGVVDAHGRTVWADQVLALLAGPLLADRPGAAIVADVKMSDALFDHIAAHGGRAVMAKSGHANIKTRMRAEGAPLAGEMSGHLFFGPPDGFGYDDALFAALKVLGALDRAGQPLAALVDALPASFATPELRFPVDPARKGAVVGEVLARLRAAGSAVDTTDGVRVREADGWWLLRASNTESVLTARAEGRDGAACDRLLARIDAELAASGVRRS